MRTTMAVLAAIAMSAFPLHAAEAPTHADIRQQFLIEALVLCSIGGLLGIALGIGGSMALQRFAGWSMAVSSTSVALAFGFSALVGVCFGFWPARRAAALSPIEALRYQ